MSKSIGIQTVAAGWEITELARAGSGDNECILFRLEPCEKHNGTIEVIETNGDFILECDDGFAELREMILAGKIELA